jgi:predicted nucleotidyltransferase
MLAGMRHGQLPPLVQEAVLELKSDLERRFGGRLRDVRVFGSVARGQACEGSDVDVLVVLRDLRSHAERVLPMELAALITELEGVLRTRGVLRA